MKVKLKQGELIGLEKETIPHKRTYHSFIGIPYAEPPINDYRFQAPVPHKGWDGILEATNSKSVSWQISFTTHTQIGSEDCLFVNVHVPQTQCKKLKPVMVWVHGGGFCVGHGNFYGADYLMEHDIILVTFNYRLNVFGFLNMGLPECSGNAGLKDQILLFEWVKENIESFGGDPDNITAAGQSAGAASIHFLMMSPICNGLFQRAILQSGSALCHWAFAENPVTDAFQLGQRLGFKTESKRELLQFLLEVPAKDLHDAAVKMIYEVIRRKSCLDLVFTPSVDRGVDLSKAVLPDKPKFLIKLATPLPLLTGINDNETLIPYSVDYCDILISATKYHTLMVNGFNLHRNIVERILNKAKEYYGSLANDKLFPHIIKIASDISFGHPFYKTCEHIMIRHPDIPVYAYKFSYEGSLNLSRLLRQSAKHKGTAHGDELFYIFSANADLPVEITPLEKDFTVINGMCTLWTNFVKFGTPSPPGSAVNWRRSTIQRPCYLDITNQGIRMEKGVINGRQMKILDYLKGETKLLSLPFKL